MLTPVVPDFDIYSSDAQVRLLQFLHYSFLEHNAQPIVAGSASFS